MKGAETSRTQILDSVGKESDGSAGRALLSLTHCSLRCLGPKQLFWDQLIGQRRRRASALQLSRGLSSELTLTPQ